MCEHFYRKPRLKIVKILLIGLTYGNKRDIIKWKIGVWKGARGMRTTGRGNIGRFWAFAAAMTLLAVVLFSAFFLAVEASHDCTGEDCPICACVRLCEKTLRSGDLGGYTARSAAIVPPPLLLFAVLSAGALFSHLTPVSGKMRLNN